MQIRLSRQDHDNHGRSHNHNGCTNDYGGTAIKLNRTYDLADDGTIAVYDPDDLSDSPAPLDGTARHDAIVEFIRAAGRDNPGAVILGYNGFFADARERTPIPAPVNEVGGDQDQGLDSYPRDPPRASRMNTNSPKD